MMRDLIGERLASYNPSEGYGDAAVLAPMAIGGGDQVKDIGDAIERGAHRKAIERARKGQMDADTLGRIQLKEHYNKMDEHFAEKRNDLFNKVQQLQGIPGGISNSSELRRAIGEYNADANSSKDFEAKTLPSELAAIDALPGHYNKQAIKKDLLLSLDGINHPQDLQSWRSPSIQPKHLFPEKFASELVKDIPIQQPRPVTTSDNSGVGGMKGIKTVKMSSRAFDRNGQPGFDPDVALNMVSSDPHVKNMIEDGAKKLIIKQNQQEFDGYLSQGYSPEEAGNKVWYAADKNGKPRVENTSGLMAKNLIDKYAGTKIEEDNKLYQIPQPSAASIKGNSYNERPYNFTEGNATVKDEKTGHNIGVVGFSISDKTGKGVPITASPSKIYDSGEGKFVPIKDRITMNTKHVGYILENKDTGQLASHSGKDKPFDYKKMMEYIETAPIEKLRQYKLSKAIAGNFTEKAKVEGDTEEKRYDSEGNLIVPDKGEPTEKNRSFIVPFDDDNEIAAQLNRAVKSSKNDENATLNLNDSPQAKNLSEAYQKRMQESELPPVTQKAVSAFAKQMGRQPTEAELQKIKAKYK